MKHLIQIRAPVLSLDPPSRPPEPILTSKVSLLAGLPMWFGAEADSGGGNAYGKLYMANLAVPAKVLTQAAGLPRYHPPFGAKTVLPLHRVT